MTGNNKIWRASLAGLASVAMLATMGVTAANAATTVDATGEYSVRIYSAETPYATTWLSGKNAYGYGSIFHYSDIASKDPFQAVGDGKVLTGYSYDLAGKNIAFEADASNDSGIAIKGDTKLYAQYAKAHKVTFVIEKTNKDVLHTASVDVKDGSAVDADAYAKAVDGTETVEQLASDYADANDLVFVGWTKTDARDDEALYTDAAITADTKLYAKFVSKDIWAQNAAQVTFKSAQSGDTKTKYTIADQAFPEFRAPSDLKGAEWQKDGKAYSFTDAVKNSVWDPGKDDLTLVGVSEATDKAWTVVYHFEGVGDNELNKVIGTTGSVNTTFGTVTDSGKSITTAYTAADGKAVEPNAPAVAGAEFTGWYLKDNNTPFDFTKAVSEQANAQAGSRTVQLYAGWDTENIVPVVYYYGYNAKEYYRARPYETNKKDLEYAGKAVNYQTKDTAIAQPTGIEDYFQTSANADHGTDKYTSRKVTAWLSLASDEPVTTVNAGDGVAVYAKWAQAASLYLDARGGNWGGANHTQYVTKDTDQSWNDVVKAPTKDGYRFAYWVDAKTHGAVNLAAGKYFNGTDWVALEDGQTLAAVWVSTGRQDAYALFSRFGLTGFNKTADVKTVVDAGYTEASATAYVDAWYDLFDDFAAAGLEDSVQASDDAFAALVPKYQAAEALLKKSGTPVEPTVENIPVYRLYNPGLPQAAQHFYTTSKTEYDNLTTSHGWKGEGIAWYTTNDEKATPVYRVYNEYTSAHFWTTDAAEYAKVVKDGWTDEGIAWYVTSAADTDVYRLYNEATGEHLYTTNAAEKDNLVANAGWTYEKVEYKVYAK